MSFLLTFHTNVYIMKDVKKKRGNMKLTGEIVEIIYQNELNSYTIAVLETEDEYTTIVGYLPFVAIGDTIEAEGDFVEHKDYGLQFKVETFEKKLPETPEALQRYLASGSIKGVGETTAKRIVDEFGNDTVKIIKDDYKKLSKIKGISLKKAEEISESFIENWEVWQIVGFLAKFGIGAENAKKAYDKFGLNAIERIEENPYILLELDRTANFAQIDKIAMQMGIEYNDSRRVKSGIIHGLICASYNGNCCVIKSNLIDFVKNLLEVSADEIEDNIISLKADDEIVIDVRDEDWVYLKSFYDAELNVAKRILMLDKDKNTKKISDLRKEVEIMEQKADLILSEKQIEAIAAVNDNNVVIITGGPGTGKTTIIKTIIDIYDKKGKKTVLCAPTGRAAKRMTETTGHEASTLHRLLEIGKISDKNIYDKKYGEYTGAPIDADIVVVDEVSMVDIFLMNYLVSCLYKGTKLILVGDSDQLSSVGPGSVLQDLLNSEMVSTIKLDKIFRQAAKSKIVVNAHRVNDGQGFLSKEEISQDMDEDFFYIREPNQEKALHELITLCTGRLEEYGNYDFFKSIQVVTPTKKGMLGTRALNQNLQESLNPQDGTKDEKKRGKVIFRVGDRVMQIKNNYDIEWKRDVLDEGVEHGSGIFNGEIGTIIEINYKTKAVVVLYDDEKIASYESEALDQIEHSYAITIHKAQGSEFDVVIMVIPPSSPMLLTRNLLYTGITRAKKLLVVIGSDNVIKYMIQNTNSKKRNTGLCERLQEN